VTRRQALLLLPAFLQLSCPSATPAVVAPAKIDLSKAPSRAFDAGDVRLREAANLFQEALNASTVSSSSLTVAPTMTQFPKRPPHKGIGNVDAGGGRGEAVDAGDRAVREPGRRVGVRHRVPRVGQSRQLPQSTGEDGASSRRFRPVHRIGTVSLTNPKSRLTTKNSQFCSRALV
jgi:hypothetical protein